MTIGVFATTDPNQPPTDPAALDMLEQGCPNCGDAASDTYLTEAAIDGQPRRVVICDACGYALAADAA